MAAAVAHDADALDRQEHGEGLADLVVKIGLAQFLDEDGVGLAQLVGGILGHGAEDAHAQAGARERVAVDHFARQAEFHTDLAHFVLEQLAQRFDQLELHVRRQAADVVMALDDVGLAGLAAGGFDHVRVDGALGEVVHIGQRGGFFVEHVDEQAADDLALGFRVVHAVQGLHEAFFGVHSNDLDAEVLGEHAHHLITFVQTQQAVVDEHAGELIADGLVQQGGNDGRIDAAGQAQQDLAATNFLAHARDGVVDDLAGRPARSAAAEIMHEARQDACALGGVGDLGMELHAVVAALVVGHRGQRHVARLAAGEEALRQLHDAVAMTHPHVEQAVTLGVDAVLDVLEQLAVAARAHFGVAEFAGIRGFD